MKSLGKAFVIVGGATMIFGLLALLRCIWVAHTTGSWLSDEALAWFLRGNVAPLAGYVLVLIGSCIERAALDRKWRRR